MLRQAVFGRVAGYEDVNDAERLRHHSAMRSIVGGKAASGCAASASRMGRFETRWLRREKNPSALFNLSYVRFRFGVPRRRPMQTVRACQEPETVAGWASTDSNLRMQVKM
jgi:hypothetical protein